jgi:hypoxanthine phosphoribosyltransferase
MLNTHRRDGYATSSFDVGAIKAEKETLRAQGYPVASVFEFVDRFLNLDRFGHLRGRDNMFLVAPSTSRTNLIPLVFAQKLAAKFGGSVVNGWATPLSTTKAAKKGGIGKIREPVRFAEDSEALSVLKKMPGRNMVLVDDVVTTGETADALRDSLDRHGLHLNEVASLGQAEMRKVTERDIERLAVKLGEPSLRAEVAVVLSGKLKHRANYIERETHGRYRSEIRDYFQNEARRYKNGLSAVQPGGERSGEKLGAGDSRLQSGPLSQAGNSPGHSREADSMDVNPRQRNGCKSGGQESSSEPVIAVPGLREKYRKRGTNALGRTPSASRRLSAAKQSVVGPGPRHST